MKEEGQEWRREVITPQVEETLLSIHDTGVLTPYYLAGGTGLALHLGHRRSHDLDFFSAEPVDPDKLIERLQTLNTFAVIGKDAGTLHATVQGIRVSFLSYAYPLLFPMRSFLGVNIADPRDIAGMKISAIAGRGAKRDFVDLYVVSKQYGLREALNWFQQKCAQANYSKVHILKSLTYFEEADKDPMPDVLTPLSWEEVREFFSKEVPPLS